MTIHQLDYFFPFLIFFYGIILISVIETPLLVKIGTERMPQLMNQLRQHEKLAWICFFVGGFWSLQNLWLT